MTITTITLEDTPEYTKTRTTDTVLKSTVDTIVYKTGTQQFNQGALQTRVQAGIADCNTAEALLNANGWDGLTANQRKLIMLGVVQDIRGLARLALGLLDSPS